MRCFCRSYFRQHGYYSAHVGKVFHTGDAMEDPASWDFEAREWGKSPPQSAVLRERRLERPGKYRVEWSELSSTDEETADGVVARQASALLDRVAQRRPAVFSGRRLPPSALAVCRAQKVL